MRDIEKKRAYMREYRIRKAAELAEYELARKHDEHRIQTKSAIDKRWKDANRIRKNATDRAWRLGNTAYSEWKKKNRAAHIEADPDYYRVRRSARRAQEAEGIRRYGRIDTRLISNYYTRLCGICGKKIESQYEIDHIIPLARNGTHMIDNLQLTHPVCNRTKSARLQNEILLDIVINEELINS